MKKKALMSTKVYINIILAVAVVIYFALINFVFYRTVEENLILGLKMVSGLILMLGIFFLEVAYNKDSGRIAIYAIELLVLSIFTLSIQHIVEINKFDFSTYILIAAGVFVVYYILKSIIVFTKERKEYLDSLSDIREIVDIKPTKKEAKKRQK